MQVLEIPARGRGFPLVSIIGRSKNVLSTESGQDQIFRSLGVSVKKLLDVR